jgi:NAD(P)H dehydrogenase (quinone)
LRIAVTGASGRLGRQVVELLAAQEAHQVVAVSRREMPSERQSPHISMATADYMDPVALRAAFRGVDTLVFVSSDGETAQVVLHHQNVIRAAADSGVAHIVALSGLDADLTSPFCYAVTYGHTERLLSDSGCSVSVARASIFTEFFMGWLLQARRSGQLRVPAADGQVSLVSRTDVGRCLAALALAPPTGRHHDITGPEALDLAAIAALTEHAWGMPIKYVDITPAEHCVEMARAGEHPWWLYAFSSMFESVRQQRWASVSEEVFRLTGRAPRSVHDVLSEWRTTSEAH